MPSSQTITSFYTFVQNTKARASQVNNNFDVFRGHIIPIHVSTQTSSDLTYDLGSTEYRWRSILVGDLDVLSNTSTGGTVKYRGATSGAVSAAVIEVDGIEVARFANIKSFTTTAGLGQIALGANTTQVLATTTSQVTVGSIQLNSSGNPVEVGFMNRTDTTSAGGFSIFAQTSTSANLFFYMDNSLMSSINMVGNAQSYTSTSGIAGQIEHSALRKVFFSPAGNHTYECRINANPAGSIANLFHFRMYAREWK